MPLPADPIFIPHDHPEPDTLKAPRPEVMEFFTVGHLPPHLRPVSAQVGNLAEAMCAEFPQGDSQLDEGLKYLLLAKDCFVRAAVRRKNREDAKAKALAEAQQPPLPLTP